jgi:Tfp pilus assembly protein PilO
MINLLDKSRILNLIGKLDNKKIFLLMLICAIILYLDLNFFIKLQLQAIRTMTPKITKLKKDIDNLAKDLAKVQDLKNRQSKDKQQMGVSKPKEIISEDQTPLLLQAISDLANKNKVKITQINTTTDAKAQEEVIAGEKLSPITIKLDLTCNYHSLGSFINDLENTKQFIELQEIKIARNPSDYFLENTNLVLKTYAKK